MTLSKPLSSLWPLLLNWIKSMTINIQICSDGYWTKFDVKIPYLIFCIPWFHTLCVSPTTILRNRGWSIINRHCHDKICLLPLRFLCVIKPLLPQHVLFMYLGELYLETVACTMGEQSSYPYFCTFIYVGMQKYNSYDFWATGGVP